MTHTRHGPSLSGILAPQRVTLAALLAVSLALRLIVAWRPIPELVLKTLPDDAFYYFTTAHNIAHGLAASLDGHTATNGFHPLWMAMLVPVCRVLERDLAVHAALTLTALLDTATIALVYMAARRLTGRQAPSLLAAAAYALNPVIVLSAVNGMESAVVLFTGVLLLNLYLRLLDPRTRSPGLLTFAVFGAVAGLAILARTDGVFLVIALLLALTTMLQPLPWHRPAVAAVVAILVVAPWFGWSLARFSTPFQVSGEASTWIEHRAFDPAANRPFRDSLGHGASRIQRSLTANLAEDYFYGRIWLVAGLATLAGAAAVAAMRGQVRPRGWRSFHGPLLLMPPTAAFLALLIAHDGVRWVVREWYFLPVVPLAALWLALAAAALESIVADQAAPASRRWGLALVAAVGLAFLVPYAARGSEDWRQGRYYWQADYYRAARWMDSNLPPNAVVGAFNAGIVSWFSGRSTINLDGVMNARAYHALKGQDLIAYADSAGITHIADTNLTIFTIYGRYWALEPSVLLDRIDSESLTTFYIDERTSRFGEYIVFPYRPANR